MGLTRRDALGQGDEIWHVSPGQEVRRGWVVNEKRPHWRRPKVELIHGRQTEDLLDCPSHVDLRVVSGVGDSSLLHVWADDIGRGAVTVDMVDTILAVIFLDEDRRGGPYRAVGDDVDKTAQRQIVISQHSAG